MPSDMFDEVTKKRWKRVIKKVLKVSSSIAEVAVQLKDRPTLLGGAAVAARAFDELWSESNDSARDFFKGWHCLRLSPLGDFVFQLFSAAQLLKEEDIANDSTDQVLTAEIHGITVGWVIYENWKDGPWVSPNTKDDEARAIIGRFIWESIGNCVRLHQPAIGSTMLERDDLVECYPSKTAEDLFIRIKRFLDAGYRRSVLIYGEPGTGKSHLMRFVVKRAGGFSLRLRSQTFGYVHNPSGAITLLRPSAVIVDDLDRIEKPGVILDAFEEIRSSTRLLLASVNDVSKLDPATLRPGRFDEVIHLERLDQGVMDRMLNDLAPEIVETLQELPIAYIDEFRKLREVLGEAEAIAELVQLHARLETIRALSNDSKETPDDRPVEGPVV